MMVEVDEPDAPYHPVLSSSVLVLNRSYRAVHIVSVRRAFIMLFRECAEVIHTEDGSYTNYDFTTWCEISEFQAQEKRPHDDWVKAVQFEILVPRIIRLIDYDRIPEREVRYNRRQIFARDGNKCQYCGKRLPVQQLSLDHVMPRSRGGESSWENVVCSCLTCNTRKGGRTPQEAHMNLMTTPREPATNPLLNQKLSNPKYACWTPFLPGSSIAIEVSARF
ncbi:HNH endonuclease [Pirellula staleyi DSM 6068]|uniref:HNH endonuclease n=1 Tax=Pirellula staleyi (strain ATCC 27377 / DSM 6068 / ICPB 4128) TaxID=530564 RepID=D2R9B6_PIRSD|nr:HNH endonuclease [Pirellula staleyi]ADB17666.1 HNH endonuclease [Pirellula staleyi DSM 6068]